jgi:hypothetical protein
MGMFHPIWRLSEAGERNLGLACNDEGLVLGRTPLIERRGGHFAVRDSRDIQQLLSRAYCTQVDASSLMSGLSTVAAALNGNDLLLARIAAVHLRIPDLPDQAARDALEAEDRLIRKAHLRPHPNELHKASPDDPKHPGWPAGTEGGRGGQFRPKDGTPATIDQEAKKRIARLAIRRTLRALALSLLRLASRGAVNIIPIVGEVLTAIEIMRTISELAQLRIEADAALEFVKKGPRALEELQVSSNGYEQFQSYDQFTKSELTQDQLAKRFGPAGDGYEYHHIVTQGGDNADNIPPEQLQNTDNIIRIPTLLHEEVSAKYLEKAPDDSGRTVYEWLQTKPYEFQREYGLKILRDLHILK